MSKLDAEGPPLHVGAIALLRRLLDYGVGDYPRPIARRLRILNGLSVVAFGTSVLFAVRYALIDLRSLYWLCLCALINGTLWGLTPFLNRQGPIIPVAYFGLVGMAGLTTFGYLAGSDAGVHYYLLVGPALVLLIGSRNVTISLALALLALGCFSLVEFGFPAQSNVAPLPPEAARLNKPLSIVSGMLIVYGAILYSVRLGDDAEAALEEEYARSEGLLLNLMPASIAARLKAEPDRIIADRFDTVTILFGDVVDFTHRAGRLSPEEVVGFLNTVFSAFDRLAAKHGLEKVKTIGDAYMVAGGMPDRHGGHAKAVAEMALDMLATTRRLSEELGETVSVRIGIHTGPAVAGVIGTRKLFYDVWGDTVNTASRMESHGAADRIQVTEAAKSALGDRFVFEERGMVPIKGKGEMRLFYLTGRALAEASKAADEHNFA